METEGSLNDFTSSEAVLGRDWETASGIAVVFEVGLVIMDVVNPAQGFAGRGVSASLSGPACAGWGGGLF